MKAFLWIFRRSVSASRSNSSSLLSLICLYALIFPSFRVPAAAAGFALGCSTLAPLGRWESRVGIVWRQGASGPPLWTSLLGRPRPRPSCVRWSRQPSSLLAEFRSAAAGRRYLSLPLSRSLASPVQPWRRLPCVPPDSGSGSDRCTASCSGSVSRSESS